MIPCTQCGNPVTDPNYNQLYVFKKNGRIFCRRSCGMAFRSANRPPPAPPRTYSAPCSRCGVEATLRKSQYDYWRACGRCYCSQTCSKAHISESSSRTMAATNRKYASDRMKTNNPMAEPEARAKMTQTMRAAGHRPKERGGNGRAATKAEVLLQMLFISDGFVAQLPIKTPRPKEARYPWAYKPDLAHPGLMLAIEADGASHTGARRVLDAKKDACLHGLGWTVLRFSNDTILTRADLVVETVSSTILRLKDSTPTSPMASSSTTATIF